MSASGSGDVSLRTVPVQERSRRTVELLLSAATQLLVTGGPEALSTSALAERTGLRVRNVYRYFPNRLAIVVALATRLNDELEAAIGDLDGLADPATDWRREVHATIDRFVEIGAARPELTQVRAAMRITPELAALDLASDHRIAATVARALRRRGVRGGDSLEARAFVLITALGAILDRTVLDPGFPPDTAIREAKTLAESYLATILTADPSDGEGAEENELSGSLDRLG